MSCMDIARYNRIKLHNCKALFLCLPQTVPYKLFTNMQPSAISRDCIACICNMAASANIIRMQNIQPQYFSGLHLLRNTTIGLLCKKSCTCLRIQTVLLWKCNSILNNLFSDVCHLCNVFFRILSDDYFSQSSLLLSFNPHYRQSD